MRYGTVYAVCCTLTRQQGAHSEQQASPTHLLLANAMLVPLSMLACLLLVLKSSQMTSTLPFDFRLRKLMIKVVAWRKAARSILKATAHG